MAFQLLAWEAVTISHVNLRDEKHGEETVSAIDIKVVQRISNDRLDDLFHPRLLENTYFNREAETGQAKIDVVPQTLPNLLFPQMQSPRKWALELTNARVVFDYGMGEEGGSNIDLHSCKIKSFLLDFLEGGSVDVTYSIQNNEFPDGVLDKLRRKLTQKLPILIIPAGSVCELVKAIPEKKEPPKEKPPRADSNTVIDFPLPADAASDAPPAIDPAQQVIVDSMQAAAQEPAKPRTGRGHLSGVE